MESGTENPDEILRRAVARATHILEESGAKPSAPSHLGEVKHLQPTLVAVMRERYGARTWPNAKTAIPGWPNVGHVDLALREGADAPALTLAVELKSEKIDEGLWDMFKMALLAGRSDVRATYLVTSARESTSSKHHWCPLFEDGPVDPRKLCELRYPTGSRRRVWDWALQGGYDSCPESVPASISRHVIVTESLLFGGKPWQLRALRVEAGGSEQVQFRNGWPDGNRPPDAKHPLASG